MNDTVNDTANTGLESGLTDPGFTCGLLCFAVKLVSTITSSHARGMDAYKLMKELRLNYEQEVQFLPKKTGLSLIASSVQVSCFSLFKRRCLSAYFKRATFGVPGRQPDLSQMQRRQSGGPLELDQLLWLRHADVCPGCQPPGQILGHDEGTLVPGGARLVPDGATLVPAESETHLSFSFLWSCDAVFVSSHRVTLRSSPSTCRASASAASTWRPR